MTLQRLKRMIDELVDSGVSPATKVCIDMDTFKEKQKIPEWSVLDINELERTSIVMCDGDGFSLINSKGEERYQQVVLIK